jgi:hypothetical protein
LRSVRLRSAIAICVTLAVASLGCSDSAEDLGDVVSGDVSQAGPLGPRGLANLEISDEILDLGREPSGEREAYFGDLHVHTTYSFDAFAFGTLATPDDAYRFAKGEAIAHPGGFEVRLREPLDFYAVTDHAMFLGLAREAADTTTEASRIPGAEVVHDLNAPDNYGEMDLLRRIRSFGRFVPGVRLGIENGTVDPELVRAVTKSAWRNIVEAARRHNDPGRFTTFVAYEYTTSTDERGNLHRNVIFRGAARVPAVPFSRFHSQNPEDLWDWMDSLRLQGIESLAIPHNSNGSNGAMFAMNDWSGERLDADHVDQRLRNEPIVEITQVKGTSDTHPAPSTNDEWADFEIMPYRVATMLPSEPKGSYVRDALLRGLALEASGAGNPFRFGLIGSSDTHTGAISEDESNYFAKIGVLDATPQLRGSVPLGTLRGWIYRIVAGDLVENVDGRRYSRSASPTFGASGLAGVWAEENSRDAIYQALRRKETFATSGPRIRVRFFAGRDLDPAWLDDGDGARRAYAAGVPMGGALEASEASPRFLTWAIRDPLGAPLQRLQIIKGWIADDGPREQVFDVACSDGGAVDRATHRCPDNGARVDPSDCSTSSDAGAAELRAVWTDPDFDPEVRAFYYVRVLENPTCRWSTWDAVRAGVPPRPDLAKTIQERAWSSPIWVEPAALR